MQSQHRPELKCKQVPSMILHGVLLPIYSTICTRTQVRAQAVDWHTASTWPEADSIDVLLGCDLVYDNVLVPSLLKVIKSLLKRNGAFFYVCGHQRYDAGFPTR
jgi:hypothetical protein